MLMLPSDESDGRMTDQQVRDEALTLFLAGHETTAAALTWTFYLLSQHPEVEARLRAELAEVLGGRAPSYEHLPKLTYAEMVLAESMRLYPPAWAIGRMAKRQYRLYNYEVSPRSICILSPYVMHRHPRFYPDPGRRQGNPGLSLRISLSEEVLASASASGSRGWKAYWYSRRFFSTGACGWSPGKSSSHTRRSPCGRVAG
jgi:hypothetical protein